MIIKTDKEGQEALKQLIDATLKSRGIEATQLVFMVMNAMCTIEEDNKGE